MSLKSYLRDVFAPNVYVTVAAPAVTVQPAPLTVTVSPSPAPDNGRISCPTCLEPVRVHAKRCPHCTNMIP